MSDKDLVMAHWESAEYGNDAKCVLYGPCYACIGKRGMWRWFYGQSAEAAWSAAAEFTRERLEQIRQVREEITELHNGNWLNWHDYLRTWSKPAMSSIVSEIRSFRTLSRLESALADMRRGMKEQVP